MRTYRPGEPLVFSHIPKTAGTSLRTALVAALEPTRLVTGVDLSLAGSWWDETEVGAEVFTSPAQLPADADLVSGHISPATTQERYPSADHVTMLRNPRVRLLSHWLHSRSLSDFDLRRLRGGAGDAFRAGRRPLREFLDLPELAPNIDNTITRFLAWPHPALRPDAFVDERDDDTLVAAAVARLEGFGYAGVVEDPGSMAALSTWLGRDVPQVHANDRGSVPPKFPADLDAELDAAALDLLDRRTRLDRRVWASVAARAMPYADLDAVLEQGWTKAIARYRALMEQKQPFRPLRRTVEAAYGVGYRLRH